jgi:hypothetical protein
MSNFHQHLFSGGVVDLVCDECGEAGVLGLRLLELVGGTKK